VPFRSMPTNDRGLHGGMWNVVIKLRSASGLAQIAVAMVLPPGCWSGWSLTGEQDEADGRTDVIGLDDAGANPDLAGDLPADGERDSRTDAMPDGGSEVPDGAELLIPRFVTARQPFPDRKRRGGQAGWGVGDGPGAGALARRAVRLRSRPSARRARDDTTATPLLSSRHPPLSLSGRAGCGAAAPLGCGHRPLCDRGLSGWKCGHGEPRGCSN
jgi:hypothetical protein